MPRGKKNTVPPVEQGITEPNMQPESADVLVLGEGTDIEIVGTPIHIKATPMGMTIQELEALCPTKPLEPPAKRRKVAILGFTDTWRLAPFNNMEFEIWGLNELYILGIPRWDRWFEIHKRENFENDRTRTSDHIEKLKAMTCPIYMQRHYDDIPMSIPYPLQEMSDLYGDYWTNSISYMIALAIAEGYEEIHVYGVDMAHDSEYNSQRPSCEYYIGIAKGKGIKVYVPPQSDLLKTPFYYGYQEDQARAFDAKLKARKAELEAKMNQLNAQLENLKEARAQFTGALQDVDHIYHNWHSQH